MRPNKSDGPDSYCCSCLLVWNSDKDCWERLYGSVVYSITKLLIGMLLSIASPNSVRAQGRTFTFVVGGLCSVFILIMNEGFRSVENFDRTLRWHGTVQYFHSVPTKIWTAERLIFVVLREFNTLTHGFSTAWKFFRCRVNYHRKVFQVVCPLFY